MHVSARKDLITYPRDRGIGSQWVVKDPVSFTHFLFSREELFLLQLLDGKRSLSEIRKLWQTEFQTRSLTEAQLKQTVLRFLNDKLVRVEKFGSGFQLHSQEVQSKRRNLSMKFASPLVIKLGGIDPGSLLDWLWLPGQLLFNRFVVVFNLLLSFLVLVYCVGHFEEIAARSATMAHFFSPQNMALVIALIAGIKVIHELAHAMACRKFGGECFEIGVLLLAFMPTLYCDVTDSWMFREKWKRMLVAFAGIYVELILASASAFLWLLTEPGLANSAFFNIAVMCSLNTVFVNGNPLLKYDGYYIFSDWINQPNLQQTSARQWNQWKSRFFYQSQQNLDPNFGLVTFGALSAAYRWLIIVSILVGVYAVLKSYQIGNLAEGVVILLLASTGYRIYFQRKQMLANHRPISWPKTILSLTVFAAIVVAICFLPVPSKIFCNVILEARQSRIVYASNDGILDVHTSPYEQVKVSQVLASIANDSLVEIQKEQQSRLIHLQDRAKRFAMQLDQGINTAAELKLIEAEIEELKRQILATEKDLADLQLKSELDGTVRPIPFVVSDGDSNPAEVDVFNPALAHLHVHRGQPLFTIEGAERQWVAYLGEKDVEYLIKEQRVELVLDAVPGKVFDGQVEEIIEIDVQLAPEEIARSGLETYVDQQGEVRVLQTPYRVVISTPNLMDSVRMGSRGRGSISVASTTILQKVWWTLDRWWQEQNY
ncbi:MAG: hypothetical protein AAF939_07235 [Planctomycetota bacterium]